MLEQRFDETLELLPVLQDKALIELENLPYDVTGLKLICPILTINAVFSIDALLIFHRRVAERVQVFSLNVHDLGGLGHESGVFGLSSGFILIV